MTFLHELSCAMRAAGRTLAAFLAAVAMTAAAADVEYAYDELGRLNAVYAPSGEAAQYVYDPAGNITQIKRFAANELAVIDFSPKSGPAGTVVVIRGTGFSTTPASNTVAFNGTAATVSGASANKLTVNVPSGATTGLISVSVGSGSALSAVPFTVTAGSAAPSISSFSPTVGAPGTAVTVSGSNFSTTLAQNNLSFNGGVAAVSSATATSIATQVPPNAGSGKLRIATPNGTAYSANDFLVPFGAFAASDLVSSSRVTVDGPSAGFSMGTPGKVTMVLFEGTQGQNLGLGFTNVVTTPAGGTLTVDVLRPDNRYLVKNASGSVGSLELPTLPLDGTYTIAISIATARTFSGTVTLSTDVTGTLGGAGSILNGSTTRAGQNGRFTFSGTAGQQVAVYVHNIASAIQPLTIDLRDPYGWPMGSVTSTGSLAYLPLLTLTTTGSHTLIVNPSGAGSGAFAIQYGVPDLVVTALTPGTPITNHNGTYSIPLTAVVANQGTVGSRGMGWKDSAYLSSDTTLDTTDRLVGWTARNTEIASGASYNVTINGSMPAGTAPGNYTLHFKTDGADNGSTYLTTDVLKESSEANNVASAAIVLPPLADLAVSGLTIGTVTASQAGAYSIPVSFTVSNVSTGPAKASWTDLCYLSADGTLGAGDTVLATQLHTTNLAGGAQYAVALTCPASSSTLPGNYTIFAKTDGTEPAGGGYTGNGSMTELGEANNVASAAVTLPPRPDLAITASSVGTITVNANGSYAIPVTFTVRNIGTGLPAKASWWDACYLSADTTLDTTDDYLGWLAHNTELAISSEYTVNLTCTTPTTTAAGAYTLFLKADGYFGSGNKYSTWTYVGESDKANNVVSIPVTLPTKP